MAQLLIAYAAETSWTTADRGCTALELAAATSVLDAINGQYVDETQKADIVPAQESKGQRYNQTIALLISSMAASQSIQYIRERLFRVRNRQPQFIQRALLDRLELSQRRSAAFLAITGMLWVPVLAALTLLTVG